MMVRPMLARVGSLIDSFRSSHSHFRPKLVKLFAYISYRFRWLGLPGAMLAAVLQRTPVPRIATVAGDITAAPRLGAVVRSVMTTIASMGAVHALAGATQFTFSRPPPISGTVGTGLAPFGFTVTGAQIPPGSLRATNLPPGLTVQGADSRGLVNASTGFVTGTPTQAGTFTTTILAYQLPNAQGDAFGPTTVVFNIAPAISVAPALTTQPVGQSVSVGATVTLTVTVSGSPAPALQWRRNGANLNDGATIRGATTPSLVLSNVQPDQAGDYTVMVSNSAGTAISNAAAVTVNTVDPSARLTNLSVRTALAASQTLIVGVVVNDGSREILVRAAGPALAAFGLSTVMADPRLELYNGPNRLLSYNDLAGNLVPKFASVGAFGFPTGSKDAAFVESINAAYSIQAKGTGPGVVLVEAYDTGEATAARLVNVSARNRVGTGDDILIAGFALSGSGAKRLLIRAVGPTLGAAPFNVPGVLSNPKLEIYNSDGVKVTENDDWDPQLSTTFLGVGAFLLNSGSRDAALVTTLPAGSYTVQVKGADGGTGEALIEIYEVR
jgi:hypothetical protein